CFAIAYFEQVRQGRDRRIDIASLRLNGRQRDLCVRFRQGVVVVIRDGTARLLQSLLFFAKAGINLGETDRQQSRIDSTNRVRRWLYRRNNRWESGTSVVIFTGYFLAVTEQRHGARIVCNRRRRVLLNLGDRFIKASLVAELQGSRHGKNFVLGIRRSFRQNLGRFLKPTLSMQAKCFRRERGVVPGRHLKDAIKNRLRLITTTDTLE